MRFLFYVPDSREARGGISVIFDIIDVLNTQGIDAVALYDRPDFEYDRHSIRAPRVWSPRVQPPKEKNNIKSALKRTKEYLVGGNRRPAANAQRCSEWLEKNGDIIIVPEYVSDWLPNRISGNTPLVILNQNPFAFFRASRRLGFEKSRFVDSISVSEACSESEKIILGDYFKRVSIFIPEEIYGYQEDKKFQVAYMPRKRGEDSSFLVGALKTSGLLRQVQFIPIDGVSGVEAARTIKDSLFFLSFSEREGFGLPAAEAMATGALVIGYSGVGGDEFFDDETGFLVPEDNLIKFYHEAISVICSYGRNKDSYDEKRKAASRKILQKYNRKSFELEVTRAFSEIARSTFGV